MATPVVEIRNVTKKFFVTKPFYKRMLNPFGVRKKIFALKDVSFGIEAGQILGVVGPNGAGKTTLIKILADVLEADSGRIMLCGRELHKYNRCLRSRIGYVSSDERSFFWRLTGRQNLEFFGRLYGLSAKETLGRVPQILEEFNFEKRADQLFRDYSTGMRKKIAVMRALLHQPQIVLLDEVTNSLDPASAGMVKTFIRKYVSGQAYCASIWSTHRLEEIAEVCDKVIIIENGKVCFYGCIDSFNNTEFSKN